MVTIDANDGWSGRLWISDFGVVGGYVLPRFTGNIQVDSTHKAEKWVRKNFAIIAVVDKTPRAFISPK
ncbi:hypothetical protein AB688_25120 [Pseudomonas putida]|uniref:Uncharacterized protein n=1 Tax=Pseudomonas putida TaxID=303 RepID=A0AAD0L9V1_PSEPU|nr:hypothetical protein AB688_25120 [Pseudomonas putida]AXA26973.1 hypothetical protein C1S65_23710 [Pseudomonas putida]